MVEPVASSSFSAALPLARYALEVESSVKDGRDGRRDLCHQARQGFSLCHSCCSTEVPLAEPDEGSPVDIVRRLEPRIVGAGGQLRVRDVWSEPGVGGRSRFLLGGMLVAGPPVVDRRFTWCSYSSLLVAISFYYLVCGSFLWCKHCWVAVTTIVLSTTTLLLMLLTAFTDPGIIPRPTLQLLVPGLQEEVAVAIGLKDRCGGRREDILGVGPDPLIMEELETFGFWWCRWCNMVQPPRAKHCQDCHSCILCEDHHCPFVNNCIGQRNCAFFYGLVVSLSLLAISFVVGVGLWLDVERRRCWSRFRSCWQVSRWSAFLSVFGALLAAAVAALLLVLCAFALWRLGLAARGRPSPEVPTTAPAGAPAGPALSPLRRGRSLICGSRKVVFPKDVLVIR